MPQINKTYIKTEATVTDIRFLYHSYSRGQDWYEVSVKFADTNGKEVDGIIKNHCTKYHLRNYGMEIGKKTTVLFNKDNPTDVVVTDGPRDWVIILGGFVLLFGGLGLAATFYGIRQIRNGN